KIINSRNLLGIDHLVVQDTAFNLHLLKVLYGIAENLRGCNGIYHTKSDGCWAGKILIKTFDTLVFRGNTKECVLVNAIVNSSCAEFLSQFRILINRQAAIIDQNCTFSFCELLSYFLNYCFVRLFLHDFTSLDLLPNKKREPTR